MIRECEERARCEARARLLYSIEPERARSLPSTSALQGSPRWSAECEERARCEARARLLYSRTGKSALAGGRRIDPRLWSWLLGCWACEGTKGKLCAWMAQKSCIEVRLCDIVESNASYYLQRAPWRLSALSNNLANNSDARPLWLRWCAIHDHTLEALRKFKQICFAPHEHGTL